jgi:flagellar protein FliO/FliZ
MNTVLAMLLKKYTIQNKRDTTLLLFCLISIFFTFPVQAQETKQPQDNDNLTSEKTASNVNNKSSIPAYFPTTTKSASTQRNIGIADFLSSFLFLAAIILLIFFLAWVFKRSGLSPGAGNQIIKIISTIPIGQKEKLAVIEVGNQQLLIAVSPGNIQKLLVLDSPVKVDEKSNKQNSMPFAAQFFNSLNKDKNVN